MNLHNIPQSSFDAFGEATINLLIDLIEAGTEPAELAEKIGWDPDLFRGLTLAEWTRSVDRAPEDYFLLITALARNAGSADPVELVPDAGTPLYGSRSAKGYPVPADNVIHEVSDSVLDGTGQRLRLLHATMRCLLDRLAQHPEQAEMIVKTLRNYLSLAENLHKAS
jgi:hypothetical protein